MTFHIGDTVTFSATADNIADQLDGKEGRIHAIDTLGLVVLVPEADCFVLVNDKSGDLSLSDCPHAEEDQ